MNQLYVYVFPLPFEPPLTSTNPTPVSHLRARSWASCPGQQVPTSYLFNIWVSESHSVMSDSLWPHGLYSPWNSPGQNTGVGSLSLPQGNLPNPGIEPRFPALQADSLPAELPGKPYFTHDSVYICQSQSLSPPCPSFCYTSLFSMSTSQVLPCK